MAQVSAFGFGGYDYIGSYGEGKMNAYWNNKDMHRQMKATKKMMNYQSQLNQSNQLWSAKNMPSATVSGLRSAGLNPLLAYTDFSGLASSGAMGVTPSSALGGSSIPSGSGNYGFDASAFDQALSIFNGRQKRANTRKAQSITSAELDTKSDVADIARELTPHSARQKMLADADDADATRLEAQNRQKEAELKAYQLSRQFEAVTGRQAWRSSTFGDQSANGSDEMNEFWTDYYRQKMDLDKWTHSAKRQYLIDGLQGISSGIGTWKGKGKND